MYVHVQNISLPSLLYPSYADDGTLELSDSSREAATGHFRFDENAFSMLRLSRRASALSSALLANVAPWVPGRVQL